MEKFIRFTFSCYGAGFLIGGLVFAFFPGQLIGLFNGISARLDWPVLTADKTLFWRVFALAMMGCISLLSFRIASDIRNTSLYMPLILCKFISSGTGLLWFLLGKTGTVNDPEAGSFAYLAIFLIDFPLGMLSLYLLKRVKNLSGDIQNH